MNIALLNSNFYTRNLHITLAIFRSLQRLPVVKKAFYCSYADVVQTCRDDAIDLLFVVDGQRIVPDIVARAAQYATRTCLWTFDDPYTMRDSVEHQHLFDHIFTNDEGCTTQYATPSTHLPLAGVALQDFLLGEQPEPEKWDIFFCGTAWPNRVRTLNRIISTWPNLRYKLALHYNKHVPATPLRGLPPSAYATPLNFREFLATCRQSKIVLGLHREFGEAETQSSLTPGPRVFEVASAGGFQICEETKGLDRYLQDGKEIVSYTGDLDLIAKIRFYLERPDLRCKIARAGASRVSQQHLYHHRLCRALDTLFPSDTAIVRTAHLQNRVNGQASFNSAAPSHVGDRRKKPRLLYVVHNVVGQPPFGGLEIHQDVLAANIRDEYEVFFLFKKNLADGKSLFCLTDTDYAVLDTAPARWNDFSPYLSERSAEKFFARIISQHSFDLVHFFHFLNNVPSLAIVSKALGVPYVVSIHDFFVACRSFNLMDHTGRFCDTSAENVAQCDSCLQKKYEIPFGSQSARREFYARVLDEAACLIYMSQDTRRLIERIYPSVGHHPLARIHGAPLPKRNVADYRDGAVHAGGTGPLRIICSGNLGLHKGGMYLVEALTLCDPGMYELHFFGSTDKNIQARIEKVCAGQAVFHGPYAPGSLSYRGFDVSLHLSVWPETYCQTLSEAWASEVVPICTDIGAFKERVTDMHNGILVNPHDHGDLARAIERLYANRHILARLRSNIGEHLYLTQKQHRDLYAEAYEAVLSGTPRRPDTGAKAASFVGFGLDELQQHPRKSTWHNIPPSHPADEPIVLGGAAPEAAMVEIKPLEPQQPLDHAALILNSPLFDATWYCERYPDVPLSGIPPHQHYMRYGAILGRNPGPLFDAAKYLAANNDVDGMGVNPLVHYHLHGVREGRAIFRVED